MRKKKKLEDRMIARIKRGAVSIETEEELIDRLSEERPLRVKLGADPSAPDIHLGHAVVLDKLKDFQELGHQIIFIIGDFTARIGDPSGRSKTRPPLSKEDVDRHAETYKEQIFKILDPDKTKVVFNSHWLDRLIFADIIRLASQSTVAQMLQRDDFAKRYASRAPISLHELLYPLAQAYDSVMIEADIEVGGTDQTFNLLLAREVQKAFGQRPQVIMTMPILEGLDGVEKMSKSLGNHIGIMEPPYEIFGKLMSISDDLMPRYYKLLTSLEYSAMASRIEHPKELKMRLAEEIVRRFYDDEAASSARKNFELAHVKKGVPEDSDWVKDFTVPPGEHWLPQLMKDSGLASSTSEARRLIRQGAVIFNGKKVTDEHERITLSGREKTPTILKVGKKKFIKIELSDKKIR